MTAGEHGTIRIRARRRTFVRLLGFLRPYLTIEGVSGWFNTFSHPGYLDANGGVGRIANALTPFGLLPNGIPNLLDPLTPEEAKHALSLDNRARCPGAIERDPGDGSIPFTDAMIVRYVDDRWRSRIAGMRLTVAFGVSSLAVWLLGPLVKGVGFGTALLIMAAIAAVKAAIVLLLPDERAAAVAAKASG